MTISAVAPRQAPASHDTQASYSIQRGDTMSAIAKQHGVSLSALLAANPQVRNADVIYPGERLDIPQGSGQGSSGSSRAAGSSPAAAHASAPSGGHPASDFSISQNGVKMLEGFEGLRLNAYQDSGGVWTIGYGHTGGVHAGQQISQAQAEQFLKQDLAWAQDAVRQKVDVPINQNQFDALVSLTYNLGANGYPGLLTKLNNRDYAGAQAMFGQYVHAGGQVLQGLVNRRAKEAALFGSSAPGGSPGKPADPPGNTPSKPSGGDYTVRSGDTMSGIAAHNGVSLSALKAANPQVHNANLIYAGQVLHLPGDGGSNAGKSHDYTVRSGDSMSAIAARNGVSLSALTNANPQIHNPNLIHPGQTVHVPGGSNGGNAAPASHDYTVRSGDSMSGIAARNGVSLSALTGANPQVHNPNLIYPGQTLHIPDAGKGGTVDGPSGPSGPSPTNGDSGKTIDIAKQFLGRNASDLKRSGELPMESWVPNNVNCANFVTAVLQKAGLINFHDNTVAGTSSRLQAQGWHKVPASQARPGDVCVLNYGGHIELVASNSDGNVKLIGSNNTNADGSQRVGYGNPYGNAYYLTPP